MTSIRRTALVLGGARSGKSAFAQRLAARLGGPVVFVATAEAHDADMEARIAAHRAERPPDWRTVEAPRDVGRALVSEARGARTILLDCLMLLVSNCLLEQDAPGRAPAPAVPSSGPGALVEQELGALLTAARDLDANLVVVSGEVGLGIVPDYPLGRQFRDLLGHANQRLAEASDAVYLVVAGVPVDLRRIAVDEGHILSGSAVVEE